MARIGPSGDYYRLARDPGINAKVTRRSTSPVYRLGDCSDTLREIRNPPTIAAAVATRKADQILDKRFNSSAQPSTTTICLETAVSGASSLIIKNRRPSALAS